MKSLIFTEVETQWKQINLVKEYESLSWDFKTIMYISNFNLNYKLRLEYKFMNNIKKKYDSCTFGGFLENRSISKLHTFIHLGIDIYNIEINSAVRAPCGSEVIFVSKRGKIILKMKNRYNGNQYLLLDHLGFVLPQIGRIFETGDLIAFLGNSTKNCGFPPRLHVQCISDYFFDLYESNNKLNELPKYWSSDSEIYSDCDNLPTNSQEEYLLKLVCDPTDLVFE